MTTTNKPPTSAGHLTSPLEAFRYSLDDRRPLRELEVFEHDGALTICTDLSALKLEEASVRVTDSYVRVKGERRPAAERIYGRFSRTVRLPVNANAAAVTWTFERGVLQITIPLLEQDTWKPAA